MLPIKVPFLLIPLAFLSFGGSEIIAINKIDSRVVGGTNATKVQFPYYAQIVSTVKINETTKGSGNCGGSVISSTFILTAAHCVKNALSVRVILGFYTVDDLSGAQRYPIKSIYVHQEYNSPARSNDIALIELNKTIAFTDFIKPIQLGCNYMLFDTQALVAGTGLTSDVNGKLSKSLQWTNLTTISNERCQKAFRMIESSNICAVGKPKQGACQGDSGTALIREVNGSQIQIGVLNWGLLRGCERGYPSVYARVSEYIDWIQQHSSVSCVDDDE